MRFDLVQTVRVFFTKWRITLVVIFVLLATCWFSRGIIASLFLNRGVTAKNEWRLTTADSYFDWSLFFEENYQARLEKGICLQLRGDFLTSQKEFDTLLKTDLKDKNLLSKLHNSIGINRYSFNEPDAAIESHERALEFARLAKNRRLEAETLIDLSRVFYHSKGRFDDAINNLEQAKSIAKEISDEKILAASLRNLGVVIWWFKGELDRPLKEFYLPALELYRKQNDQRGTATMLTLIAMVFNNKGDAYRLMQYQNESIEIQKRIGDEAGLCDSYMSLGILYSGTGNYRKAREFLSKGLEIAERTGYRLAQNDFQALLANVHLNLNEFDEAVKLYDPQFQHKIKDSVLSNYTLKSVAKCYHLKGDYEQALSLYERALQVHEKAGLPDARFKANALLHSAECHISLGNWQHAAKYMERADEIFQQVDTHSEGDIQPALVRATLAQHAGKYEESIKHFQDALETELKIFATARTNFLIPLHAKLYERLFKFLFDNNCNNATTCNQLAFSFLENMRYRSLRNFLIQVRERREGTPLANEKELKERIETLSRKLRQQDSNTTREELHKAYNDYENLTLQSQLEQPQYLAIRSAKPVTISEIQNKLSPRTVLMEFVFAGENVFALLITKSSLQSVLLPISKSKLSAKTKLFRSLIFTDGVNANDWIPVSESLRDALIEPLEQKDLLRDVNTIGFIPQGFLHGLPFAALTQQVGNNTKFLIEDYSLFQTPSATFYSNNAESVSTQFSTLAFGRNNSTDENLPTLDFAEDEARFVAQTMNGTALVSKQATETEIKQRVHNFELLHLSTHSVSENEMPLFSRLLFEPTKQDDGNLTVREIFELGLKTKLVALSACDTGQSYSASGNESNDQDRIGLIEAFLHAGSQSVLASMFPVSDKPTAELMTTFYKNLQTYNKADALAQTQRAMIRDVKLKHPRYWSPFVIVGSDN